jgi:hypothetical protein
MADKIDQAIEELFAKKKKGTKKASPVLDRLMLGMDVRRVIEKKAEEGKITFDCGGHFRGENRPPNDPWGLYDFGRSLDSEEQLVLLKAAVESGVPLTEYLPAPKTHFYDCWECSERVEMEFDGTHFRCTNPCKYPGGMPAYDVFLNVPSGKMVVANDLREYFRVIGDYNVNYTEGCKKTTEAYEKVGMAHAFVSNTCPGVYKVSDRKFVIGCGTQRNRPVKGSRRVAGICTDLWWYSIVDYDQFKARAKREPDTRYEEIVKCEPGLYRFRHQYHLTDRDDYTHPVIYTFVDRVKKPAPVVDYEAEYMKLDFTAGQIMRALIHGDHKDYYTDDGARADIDTIFFAADRMMCTAGTGRDYHPNGWFGNNPDLKMDAPDMEIPKFKKKWRWYPWSEHSLIPQAAGVGKDLFNDKVKPDIHLNPSFLALAINICQCIIRCGSESVYDNDKKHAKQDEANARKWALKSLKGFANKYPDQFPEDCRELLKLKE